MSPGPVTVPPSDRQESATLAFLDSVEGLGFAGNLHPPTEQSGPTLTSSSDYMSSVRWKTNRPDVTTSVLVEPEESHLLSTVYVGLKSFIKFLTPLSSVTETHGHPVTWIP